MNNVVSALTARAQLWQIIRRTCKIAPTPDWLQEIGTEAKRKGLHKVSMRQIDAEIAAARRERRQRTAVNSPAK
jgi:hypothetical protein